jgi:hypothetical protein
MIVLRALPLALKKIEKIGKYEILSYVEWVLKIYFFSDKLIKIIYCLSHF